MLRLVIDGLIHAGMKKYITFNYEIDSLVDAGLSVSKINQGTLKALCEGQL